MVNVLVDADPPLVGKRSLAFFLLRRSNELKRVLQFHNALTVVLIVVTHFKF